MGGGEAISGQGQFESECEEGGAQTRVPGAAGQPTWGSAAWEGVSCNPLNKAEPFKC